MIGKHYRQGDVLLVLVDGLPKDSKQAKPDEEHRIVLAYGEVTGHAHAVSTAHAVLYEAGPDRYIDVKSGAALVHEEHSTINLDPGTYKVVRQREYVPQSWRVVAD
jgi:hypothetical protein